MLGQLESFVVKLRIDVAYCNGQRVAELAEDEKRAVTEEDLVSCLENVDRHALLRTLPAFRYYATRVAVAVGRPN